MRYFMKLSIPFTVVFSLLSGLACGQDAGATRLLADQYFQNGAYKAALSAYQRIVFFESDTADAELLARIAACFEQTGSPDRALEYYDHAYFASADLQKATAYLFEKVALLLEQQQYHAALVELLSLTPEPQSTNYYRQQLYLGTAWFGLEDFEQAATCFAAAVPPDHSGLSQQIENLYLDPRRIVRPDPKTARILSIIFPGTGQLYAGDPVAGLNSFLLTGTLVGMVLYLTIRVHPLEAILTGIPWFQRYYQGGFDQAAETARKNRERHRNQTFHETLSLIGQSWQD